MNRTTEHLTLVATHWDDLADTLGTHTVTTWPPTQLRTYLRELDQHDAHEIAGLRHLERDPAQIGATRPPLRIDILDTMHTITAALLHCADQIASSVQRPVMSHLPEGYPAADRHRRALLVAQDRNDPRRWAWTGPRPTAPHAALWLAARVEGGPGPFQPLTTPQQQHIAVVARGAAQRLEHALDLGAQQRELDRPCACGGRITIRGGSGNTPTAHCRQCGATWTEQGVAA
ncbi:hypothetical protein [Streptomyces sp. SCSIO ZS0520]|uniref:hypothetical protein n=1 Tax=Streptomyces sp. SCSIO ZS0520 TaxID=2892996 RepID=UPI0021D923F3|nr:hypothetical protein [Streptomyces sp. SCSIO ZS0520]